MFPRKWSKVGQEADRKINQIKKISLIFDNIFDFEFPWCQQTSNNFVSVSLPHGESWTINDGKISL